MNSRTKHVSARPGRARGCAICIGIFLLALVLLVALAVFRSRQQTNTELARIRSAGEPATAAELETFYRLPDGVSDGTQLWLSAVTPLGSVPVSNLPFIGTGSADDSLPGKPWADMKSAVEILAQYQLSIDAMHRAAEDTMGARYPTDFKLGVQMLLEHANNIRPGARMLALQAHVHAHQGEAQAVIRDFRTGLALAGTLKNEPILVSQLVHYACHQILLDQIRRLLSCVDFSDDQLRELQSMIRDTDYSHGLYRAMLGERVLGIVAFDDPRSVGVAGPLAVAWRVVRGRDLRYYLRFMSQSVEAARQPFPTALNRAKSQSEQLQVTLQSRTGFHGMGLVMTSLLAPALEASFNATARINVYRDATDVAISVERFRRHNGTLPNQLEDLVPAYLRQVPIDSFDGQPLRYVKLDNGFVVYGIGRDLVDDGGLSDEKDNPDTVVKVIYSTRVSESNRSPNGVARPDSSTGVCSSAQAQCHLL